MPSMIIGNKSGGDLLISGNPWSGTTRTVTELRWPAYASGHAYVALSGNMTVNSGGYSNSGTAGLMDGRCLAPGGVMLIPKSCVTASGLFNIYVACDAAASGQARIYFENY